MAADIRFFNNLSRLMRENRHAEVEEQLSGMNMDYNDIRLMGHFSGIIPYLARRRILEYDDVLFLLLVVESMIPGNVEPELDQFDFEEMNQKRLLLNSLDVIKNTDTYHGIAANRILTNKIYGLIINRLSLDLSDLEDEYLDILDPYAKLNIENKKFIRPIQRQIDTYRHIINPKNGRERRMPQLVRNLTSFQLQRLEAEKGQIDRRENAKIDQLLAIEDLEDRTDRAFNRRVHRDKLYYEDDYQDENDDWYGYDSD